MSRRHYQPTPEERERTLTYEQWTREREILDRQMTRRELIEAVEAVVLDIGGSGMETQDLICDALRKFIEKISP